MIGVVLLAVAAIAYSRYPPFRLLTWFVVGRSPDCPLAQALASERNLEIEREYADRISKQSKLISLDADGFELWQTPKVRYWIPRGRQHALASDLAEQEREIYGTGDAGPRAGDIVVDCGAKFGVTVTEELMAGALKVVAIDPAPENVECLNRNFSNEIATGRVVLYPLTNVDKAVAELGLPRVDYMRIDTESVDVLTGARDTIAKFRPRISIATNAANTFRNQLEKIRPDYQFRCGPCTVVKESHSIRPDVLYVK